MLGKANHKCAIWSLLGLGVKAPDSESSERSESRGKQAAVDAFLRQGFQSPQRPDSCPTETGIPESSAPGLQL